MSIQGLAGIILSLLMVFSSICAPDSYQEITVSDPVLRVHTQAPVYNEETESYDYEPQNLEYDFTGLTATLGVGADGDGSRGAVRLSGSCKGAELSALASVEDGTATILVNGMKKLLTASVPTEEELERLIASLAGDALPAGILDFGRVREMVRSGAFLRMPEIGADRIFSALGAALDSLPMQKRAIRQSEETFFGGEVTADVTRVDFEMTAEQAQALVRQGMENANGMLGQYIPEADASAYEGLGPVSGAYFYGENALALDITCKTEEIETIRVELALYAEGDDFRGRLAVTPERSEAFALDLTGFSHEEGGDADFSLEILANGRRVFSWVMTSRDGVTTRDAALSLPGDSAQSESTLHSESVRTENGLRVDARCAKTIMYTEGFSYATYLDLTLDAQNNDSACKCDARLTYGTLDDLSGNEEIVSMRLSFDGAASEKNGAKTVSGPLSFDLNTGAWYFSLSFSCGVSAKTAPLAGYLVSDFPADMERVDVTVLTEEELGQLQNIAMGFFMGLMTLPGAMALMSSAS